MATMTLAAALNSRPAARARRRPESGAARRGHRPLGGVFRVTDGLQRDFGADRVMDTPLAEAGIMGIAVGLAYRGYRPVVEIQFDGFVYPAIDQLVTQVAAHPLPDRRRGPHARSPSGSRTAAASAPSSTTPSRPRPTSPTRPGLRVVTCANPQDAHTMIRQAIACDDPVVFFEPKRRYWVKGEVDESLARRAAARPGPRRRRGHRRHARRLRPARRDRAGRRARRAGRRAVRRGGRPALAVAAGPRHARGVGAQDRPARRHARGPAQRRSRCGDRREHHRPLLRRPQGGPRAGDRLRHPVPARPRSRTTSCPTSTGCSMPSTA